MSIRDILRRSVFRPLKPGAAMNDILAALFHRSAATLYFVYSLWAVFALVYGVIPVEQGVGETIGQIFFPTLVLLTAGPACFGATFWPNMARLELFAGSAFVMTIVIYLFFVFQSAVIGDGNWAGFVVLLSLLVLPAARTAIVVLFLLRQADERKSASGE